MVLLITTENHLDLQYIIPAEAKVKKKLLT